MRKITFIVYSALLLPLSLFAQVDSSSMAKLSDMLEQYYDAMLFEDNAVKESECDYLIESCKDSLVRQFVATKILEHYMDPPLMGEESVAIYIYEKWFMTGKIKIADSWKDFEANAFYQFNHQSMIDMQAPEITLYDSNGKEYIVPGESISVLYFSDTSCAKCKLNSAWLPSVLAGVHLPIVFYAVYCGTDEVQWHEFAHSFYGGSETVKVLHLWDPQMDSDYQMKYGVTSTPKLFFIDDAHIIRGRRLDKTALEQILTIYESYYYGQSEEEKEKS